MRSILITGNKGFIASGLHGDGIDIKDGIDIVSYRATRKYEVVIHTAAKTSVTESMKDPKAYVRTNLVGTLNMLLEHPESHFVYLSTAGVYGEGEFHTVKYSVPNPSSIYASTKLAGEFLIRNLAKSWTILRLTNVIGDEDRGEANVYQVFRKADVLPIYGDGFQSRDFIRVEKVREAINYVVKNNICGTYNVGSGHSKTILQVADEFKKPIQFFPAREGEINRFGIADAFDYSSES